MPVGLGLTASHSRTSIRRGSSSPGSSKSIFGIYARLLAPLDGTRKPRLAPADVRRKTRLKNRARFPRPILRSQTMSSLADQLPRTTKVLEDGIADGLHLGAQVYVSLDGKVLGDGVV